MSTVNLLEAVEKLKQEEQDDLVFKISKGNADVAKFVPLRDLVEAAMESSDAIEKGLEVVAESLGGEKYKPEHFGYVAMIPLGRVEVNLDIQRHIECTHIGTNILPRFDPRITMPISLVHYPPGAKHPETGETLTDDLYTSWDGQQTASTVLSLIWYGLVDVENFESFPIKANIIPHDLGVPASEITGEAVANFGFRTHNGSKAKKPVDPYYVMRSEHNGARLYKSTLQEDVHSNLMWTTMEKHKMLPAPSIGTEKKLPGHIAHISGMKTMAGHDTSTFDIKTFERTIKFLSNFFSTDNGINSSFFMAIAELFQLLKEQDLTTGFKEGQFAQFIKSTYSNSHGFSKHAKNRLYKFQDKLAVKRSWTDACSVPYMIDDYIRYCGKNNLDQGSLPIPPKYRDYVNVVEKL